MPWSTSWHPDAILVARHWREVAHNRDDIGRVRSLAQERKDAVFVVVRLEQIKAVPIAVDLIQGRFGAIHPMQVGHTALQAALEGELEQMPVDAVRLGPLVALAKIHALKEQLLARMPKHVREQQAQRGEFL